MVFGHVFQDSKLSMSISNPDLTSCTLSRKYWLGFSRSYIQGTCIRVINIIRYFYVGKLRAHFLGLGRASRNPLTDGRPWEARNQL